MFVYIYVYGGCVCMVKPGLNQTKFMAVVDSRVKVMELGRGM